LTLLNKDGSKLNQGIEKAKNCLNDLEKGLKDLNAQLKAFDDA